MKVILVTWYDAYSFDEWFGKAEIEAKLHDQPKGALTITTGILYKETEDGIVLVQSLQEATEESSEDFSALLFIPRGMIQEIEVLKDTG